ncbi:MAG TPA: phosphatase PAP2 family protein [Bacillota bacterium]|mgnify:CR=1 FL=1|nr:phosphatase PAP2 family protein [Bacillota bacterium]
MLDSVTVFEFLRSIATPGLDRVMKVITDLGSTSFYMVIIPILYWCISKSLGFSLAIVLSVSNYINVGIKFIVCRLRPYVVFPHLDAPEYLKLTGTGYSFPSGHAQVSSTFWTHLARSAREKWIAVTGIIVVVFVAFTRVYCTVHYPSDVLVGAVLGVAIAYLYAEIENRVRASGQKGKERVSFQLAVSVVAPGLAFALSALFNPMFTEEVAQVLGFIAGVGVGYTLEAEYVKYNVRAGLLTQVIKIALGLAGMMGVRYGLKAIFPGTAFWNMLRYAMVAVWATLGAPFVFKHLFKTESSTPGS